MGGQLKFSNLIAQVVQQKGYAQVNAASERDKIWQAVVGEVATGTRVGNQRRGTLDIHVANSLLMQELTFRKEELITKLQSALPEAGIQQLRFRVGQVN
jgi:predicted nucleic acid-binding Zn ribbon protein